MKSFLKRIFQLYSDFMDIVISSKLEQSTKKCWACGSTPCNCSVFF